MVLGEFINDVRQSGGGRDTMNEAISKPCIQRDLGEAENLLTSFMNSPFWDGFCLTFSFSFRPGSSLSGTLKFSSLRLVVSSITNFSSIVVVVVVVVVVVKAGVDVFVNVHTRRHFLKSLVDSETNFRSKCSDWVTFIC